VKSRKWAAGRAEIDMSLQEKLYSSAIGLQAEYVFIATGQINQPHKAIYRVVLRRIDADIFG